MISEAVSLRRDLDEIKAKFAHFMNIVFPNGEFPPLPPPPQEPNQFPRSASVDNPLISPRVDRIIHDERPGMRIRVAVLEEQSAQFEQLRIQVNQAWSYYNEHRIRPPTPPRGLPELTVDVQVMTEKMAILFDAFEQQSKVCNDMAKKVEGCDEKLALQSGLIAKNNKPESQPSVNENQACACGSQSSINENVMKLINEQSAIIQQLNAKSESQSAIIQQLSDEVKKLSGSQGKLG